MIGEDAAWFVPTATSSAQPIRMIEFFGRKIVFSPLILCPPFGAVMALAAAVDPPFTAGSHCFAPSFTSIQMPS